MRRWLAILLFSTFALGQTPQIPQTPRQALLELLKATSAEQIDKHTPDVLLAEMAKLPADVRQKQHQSMMFLSLLMAMSPNTVQTFDAGPTLAVIQDPKQNSKVEISVERDDLTGDIDTMEFSIHIFKDGKEQELPIDPRILVDMKLENNVWKLARFGGSVSIQLDDPKVAARLVKSIQDQMAKTAAVAPSQTAPRTMSESNVVISLRTLNTAEVSYLMSYPKAGFTCRLSDLGGSLSGKAADEHGAQLINPALEGGSRYGYKIQLSACEGSTGYKIVAAPMQKGVGHRTYCTDQSDVIRSVDEADSADCFGKGKPVN
jgi:hypothetical protein